MKKYYLLLNHELNKLHKTLLPVCAGMIIIQLILVSKSLENYSNRFERFENLLSISGSSVTFLVCFIVITGLCIFNIYSDYFESKGIYTLLTLPQKRETVYFAKLSAFLLCFLMLVASQLISITLSYPLAVSISGSNGFGPAPMTHGFFLSFVRSDYLRFLIPLGMTNFISSIVIFISFVSCMYYGFLCERSKKFWRLSVPVINAGLIIYVVNYRVKTLSYWGHDFQNIALFIFIQLAIAGFAVYDSIRLIKRSAIV